MNRTRTITIAITAAAAALALGLGAQPSRSGEDEVIGSKRMHVTMERMADALKATAESLQGEGDSERALRYLENLQEQMIKAKSMTPHVASQLDDRDEKDASTREFRRHVIGVMQKTLEMELLLLDDDTEGAWEIISGDLLQLRKAAHNEFKPEE